MPLNTIFQRNEETLILPKVSSLSMIQILDDAVSECTVEILL